MKKTILILTAVASLTIANMKAGTPYEDFKANIPNTKALDAELRKAEAALLLSHGERASYLQLETAMAHEQANLDKQKAILRRGVEQCMAGGPEYYKDHIGFWIDLASLLIKTEDTLNELKASTQKQLTQSQ
jgi:hypothetical protein